ncbi:hypothetical protein Ancab_023497 [Ancistrocladus abbreviatus]
MGKLGKKARKFAKKNLQSVLKRKRKLKSIFKKRTGSRDERGDQAGDTTGLSDGRKPVNENLEDVSLSVLSSDDDINVVEDVTDSDGLLSEDSSCLCAGGSRSDSYSEESSPLSSQSQKIKLELEKQKKQLERLKQKDPAFINFLSKHSKGLESLQKGDMYSDDDEMSDHDMQLMNGISASEKVRLLTSSVINSWCILITQQHNLTALPSLLNAYRSACHYGAESTDFHGSDSTPTFQSREAFCSTILFMLREGNNIFRSQLGISSNYYKIETISELENTSKWKMLKPMVKSYLRSTLFLLHQLTDTEILAYSLIQLRGSIIFFTAFPALLRRLIQVSVNLWATGGGTLSSSSFHVIFDVASLFGSDWYDNCLKKVYKAFMARCRVMEVVNLNHVQSLRDSFVELCSIDMQKSVSLALLSIQKLAKIFQLGLQTKKKEALKMICSWEYVLCIDLWVKFVSANIRDNDLHGLLFLMIQVINGIAYLFPGPRYLPLRVRCIQWLNHLSSSGGVFIPLSSLVLDILEYKTAKEVGRSEKVDNFPTSLKLPKHWLKSQNFQEQCVFAAIELLSAHFEQWSYHISFPELATIPIIYLRKFQERSTVESLRNMVKHLIEQVEKNIDFVQKKRDEVSFTPRDQESVKSFLQVEKVSGNAPFTQYYKSIMQKAASRNPIFGDDKSLGEQKPSKRRKQKA